MTTFLKQNLCGSVALLCVSVNLLSQGPLFGAVAASICCGKWCLGWNSGPPRYPVGKEKSITLAPRVMVGMPSWPCPRIAWCSQRVVSLTERVVPEWAADVCRALDHRVKPNFQALCFSFCCPAVLSQAHLCCDQSYQTEFLREPGGCCAWSRYRVPTILNFSWKLEFSH